MNFSVTNKDSTSHSCTFTFGENCWGPSLLSICMIVDMKVEFLFRESQFSNGSHLQVQYRFCLIDFLLMRHLCIMGWCFNRKTCMSLFTGKFTDMKLCKMWKNKVLILLYYYSLTQIVIAKHVMWLTSQQIGYCWCLLAIVAHICSQTRSSLCVFAINNCHILRVISASVCVDLHVADVIRQMRLNANVLWRNMLL